MPQISKFDKARIISYVENGWSIRQIAGHFNVNKDTVRRIIKRWREDGTVDSKPGCDRPGISTAAQDLHLVNALRENPFLNVVEAVSNTNFPGSSRTGRRRVKD
jgi:transposase